MAFPAREIIHCMCSVGVLSHFAIGKGRRWCTMSLSRNIRFAPLASIFLIVKGFDIDSADSVTPACGGKGL